MLNLLPNAATNRATPAPALFGLTFNLPEAIPYITSLRNTVRCLLQDVGIRQQDIDDLESIIGELATNAVRHAKGGNYYVAIELRGDQVTVTVTDNGVGFIVEGIAEAGTSRPDELSSTDEGSRIGGFGLLLIHSLCDDVDISCQKPHGTIVRLHKTVRHTKDAKSDFE